MLAAPRVITGLGVIAFVKGARQAHWFDLNHMLLSRLIQPGIEIGRIGIPLQAMLNVELKFHTLYVYDTLQNRLSSVTSRAGTNDSNTNFPCLNWN